MNDQTKLAGLFGIVVVVAAAIFFQKYASHSMSQENTEHAGDRWPSAEEIARLPADGGAKYNRLIFQKSPYLLQHAKNPVDWYAWGPEAFEKARKEDKPIFLSIGYATCHWCHVMEHESFEDSTVAQLLNKAFVCIKVDREERPDIDQIYMQVCQAMTGGGGWPLTIIMTPDKKPFYAGTYFPRETRFQRIGMLDLIPRIEQIWRERRADIEKNADQMVAFLQQDDGAGGGDPLTDQVLTTAFRQLQDRFDPTYGGFGQAPKFPSPHNLIFLLRYWHKTQDAQALVMVETTLQHMRNGGLFDHVGFGFHRYSTDQKWFLPHFEKMLYDQAMLALVYTETYQATGKQEYADTAREIFTYVLRDMTDSEGGFYSAEDADSEGEEGLFYLWTQSEILQALGEEEGAFVNRLFNTTTDGNFLDEATRQKTGRNHLHRTKDWADLARSLSMPEDQLKQRWEHARQKLFALREKRVHPLKDDKILTDWNGLMIAALAKAATALSEPVYAEAAGKAADFIWNTVRDDRGKLLKRYRQGEAGLPANANDYAFMIWGLLNLYESTFDIRWLERAIALNDVLLADFWDPKSGGLFFATNSLGDLLVRNKEIYDGAIPSANSVAAMNLLRISRMTGNTGLEEKAMTIGRTFSRKITEVPIGSTQLMSALVFAFGPTYEVVVAGDLSADDTREMLKALHTTYFPNKVMLFRPGAEKKPPISRLAAFTEFQRAVDGKATAFVCKNFACNAPTTNVREMLTLLAR